MTTKNTAVDLCSVEEVKRILGIQDSDSDPILQGIVTGVSARMQAEMKLTIPSVVITTELHTGTGNSTALVLKNAPIISLELIEVDGAAETLADLKIDKPAGIVYRPAGTAWPKGDLLIDVDYTSGYAIGSFPLDLVYACARQCALEAKQSAAKGDHLGEQSQSIEAGGTISWITEAWLPDVKRAIGSHARLGI